MNLTASLGNEVLIRTNNSRMAVFLCIVLVIAGLILTPYADEPLMQIPGYMTAFGSAMVVINLILAFLLLTRGGTEQNSGVNLLGLTFLFVGVIFLPLMASFKDGLIPGTIIGTPVSSVWLWIFWHLGFGLWVMRFAYESSRERPRHFPVAYEIPAILILILVLTLVSTLGLPYLPPLFINGRSFFTGDAAIIPWIILLVNVAGTIMLLRLRDKSPEHVWLIVGMFAACFDVWLTFRGINRFSLGWYTSKLGSLITSLAVLISLLIDFSWLYKRSQILNTLMTKKVGEDALTKLANRHKLGEVMEIEWHRAMRSVHPISFLMIDIDYFKNFNDRLGHIAGDKCLIRMADILRDCAKRHGDLPVRFGGEEFLLFLPDTSVDSATLVAQSIHQKLKEAAIANPDSIFGFLTVSIGISTIIPNHQTTPESAILAADNALYVAKRLGRNQTITGNVPT